MATIQLPPDFREFLKLLNSSSVEYLVIGGYAVNYYGFPRATADLDIWIAVSPDNAQRITEALRGFGFPQADAALFQRERQIIRMGVPPVRLEILTTISGVDFADCYARRLEAELDGVTVNFIQLDDLKRNKRASGRLKDRVDLEQLP
jgi:predicted nucleotidyltransferase